MFATTCNFDHYDERNQVQHDIFFNRRFRIYNDHFIRGREKKKDAKDDEAVDPIWTNRKTQGEFFLYDQLLNRDTNSFFPLSNSVNARRELNELFENSLPINQARAGMVAELAFSNDGTVERNAFSQLSN